MASASAASGLPAFARRWKASRADAMSPFFSKSRPRSIRAAASCGSIGFTAAALAVSGSISCLAAALAASGSISCLAAALAASGSISCLAAALAVSGSISRLLGGCSEFCLSNPFQPYWTAINDLFAGRKKSDRGIYHADKVRWRINVGATDVAQRKFPAVFVNGCARGQSRPMSQAAQQ